MEPQQLQQLEGLCQEFYSAVSRDRRTNAERALYEYLQNCALQGLVSIVSYSAMPQLVFFALSTLLKRLTQQWNDLTSEEKLYIEQTLVSVLFESPANRLEAYAVAVTAQTLARVTRLGWLENDQYKSTVGKALESGKQSHYHCSLALKYFDELITDIVEPIKSRPITAHRKIALNFRDEGLFGIVTFSQMLILQYANLPKELLDQALGLFHKCFSFDFLGIIPEEISEDPVCIQIPITWSVLFDDRTLLDCLETLCLSTGDKTQHLVLRCINQLGAARKSVFSSAERRKEYATCFLTLLAHIAERGSLCEDSLFEYVQLSKRFFMNFQIRELSELQPFPYWLQSFYNSSLQFFNNEAAISSPSASSLSLWSYLATEAHHHLQQTQAPLTLIFPTLFLNYIQTTLKLVTQELLVDTYPDLKDNLECAGTMNCYYYSQGMRALQGELETLIPLFPEKRVIGQIAWVIYLAGSLIALTEKSHKEREEQLDSKMISSVFELCRLSDRLPTCQPALEMSLIFFMNSVRKAYINTAHDTLVLFYEERIDDELNRNSLNEGKVLEVVDCIIQKILSNLSRFQGDQSLISASLELLEEMLKGYYSNKLVIQLPIALQLMTQYRMLDLFKGQPKNRRKLYASLANLWVGDSATGTLDEYLEPLKREIITRVGENALQQDWVLLVLSELRGVCSAITNQKNYLLFFDWIYPSVYPVIPKIVEQHLYTDEVMILVLQFLDELVSNRNTRIRFEIVTASGIILFKEVSSVLLAHGKVILDRTSPSNLYKEKYRFVLLNLRIFTKLLAGGYVVFGVFQVYNDPCFLDSLSLAFRLIGCIPFPELLTFPKIYEVTIELLELITKSHLALIFSSFPGDIFELILALLSQGFKSDNIKICMAVSNAINYICEHVFKALQRGEKPGYQEAVSTRMAELLQMILEIVLSEDNNFMWTLSKPLLGLIVICEMQYEQVRNFVVQKSVTDPIKQEKVMQAFITLMTGVNRSLDIKNRDKFSRNFSELRQVIISLG